MKTNLIFPLFALSVAPFLGSEHLLAEDYVHVFGRGSDGSVHARTWNSSNGSFNDWYSLGGNIEGGPDAYSRHGDHVGVVVRSATDVGHIKQNAWTSASGWVGWTDLWTSTAGSMTSDPSATPRGVDALHVFARGSDGGCWTIKYVDSVGWGAWSSLGGTMIGGPDSCSLNANHLTVFIQSQSTPGRIKQRTWTTSGGWGAWADLWTAVGGNMTSDPSAVVRGTNKVHVFARGGDGACWIRSYTDGVGWAEWYSIGGQIVGAPDAYSRNANHVAVVARSAAAPTKFIKTTWSPTTGWGAWDDLGGDLTSSPGAVARTGPTVPAFATNSWTVAVLPDTQYYTQNYPQIFDAQTKWIAQNKTKFNIQFVLHLGDCSNNNIANQWQNVDGSMATLDGVVPYAIVPGNHDYGVNGDCSSRTTSFSTYFPVSRFSGWPTFGGVKDAGRTENTYHLFSAGGVNWLVLALEWGPRNAVTTWANNIIAQYPTRKIMMITHAYMYHDDTRYNWAAKGANQNNNPHSPGYGTSTDPAGTNDGEELWNKVVKNNRNFVMTFSGHVLGDGLGRLSSTGANGNIVHQVLVNYQMKSLGGEGYLRLVEFRPDRTTVQHKSYSPYLGTYKADAQNQFTLTLSPAL